MILVGLTAPHVRPMGTVSVKETVPVNPLTAAMLIVEVAVCPTFVAVGDVAETVKLVT